MTTTLRTLRPHANLPADRDAGCTLSCTFASVRGECKDVCHVNTLAEKSAKAAVRIDTKAIYAARAVKTTPRAAPSPSRPRSFAEVATDYYRGGSR